VRARTLGRRVAHLLPEPRDERSNLRTVSQAPNRRHAGALRDQVTLASLVVTKASDDLIKLGLRDPTCNTQRKGV
jgi:hypothetical protein